MVAFDYAYFTASYPELAAYVTQTQGAGYFTMAGLYCDNTTCSPIQDASIGGIRYVLLHMLTAHIAKLLAANTSQAGGSQAASPLVGRINSASEGSVSVSAEMPGPTAAGQAWYQQTQYGAMYWQASAQYRMFRHIPGPEVNPDPWGWSLGQDNPWGIY